MSRDRGLSRPYRPRPAGWDGSGRIEESRRAGKFGGMSNEFYAMPGDTEAATDKEQVEQVVQPHLKFSARRWPSFDHRKQ
ncbi:hypothetical protein GCM10027344_01290 [Spelaeicoccus albus]